MSITTDQTFRPLTALRTKYILWVITIVLAIATFVLGFVRFVIWADELDSFDILWIAARIVAIVGVSVIVLGIIFSYMYFPSVNYKITNEEVLVNRGLITKSNKVVPYRTITNIDIKRGPFDRILGIGSVELQTAGYSANKTGPEERIDGIPVYQVEELRELIINRVRKLRGSPATSHDLDHPEEDVLSSILAEIRQLKKFLVEKL